ncbi:hypothetical protein [Sulfurimonas sp.]
MVKKVFSIFLVTSTFISANVYETNCIKCHKRLPVSIDKYFYRYLLKYSSERDVKNAMINYLKNPSKDDTVMPDAFISRFGVKKKSSLNEKELKEAIGSYWKKYKVIGKLK